jgi:hypothetical protein
MPRRVKPVSREIRAAVGELVIEATWIEYLATKLVTRAGLGLPDDEMSLLQPGSDLFKLAPKGREVRGLAGGRADAIVAGRG